MSSIRSRSRVFLALCLIALTFVIFRPIVGTSVGRAFAQSPASQVEQALSRVAETAGYDFSVNLRQRETPLPTLATLGQSSQDYLLRLEGSNNTANERVDMTIWADGGSLQDRLSGAQVLLEDGVATAIHPDGQREPIDNFTEGFAPAGDFTALIVGASDVVNAGTETQQLPSGAITYTRYQFTLDGTKLANVMRDRLQAQLEADGELPAGVTLSVSDTYAKMIGTGELWVLENGYPLRQIVDAQLPPTETAQQSFKIDLTFSNFVDTPTGAAFTLPELAVSAALPALTDVLTGSAFVTLILLGLLIYTRSRRFRTAITMLMVMQMSGGTLMQAWAAEAQHGYRQAFAERHLGAEAMVEHSAETTHAVPVPDFPQLERPTAQQQLETIRSDSGNDPDNNGLSAVEEMMLGVTAMAEQLADDPNHHPYLRIDPTLDSDNDGLTDREETLLGLAVHIADTDSDGVTDGQEVLGFSYNGRMWYGDPLRYDTNRDGINDVDEWQGTARGLSTWDTDLDGTPDLYDDDNDDDGVTDKYDISPQTSIAATFSYTNEMQLQVDGVVPDRMTFVNLQLRPSNVEHLQYAHSVLDWPFDIAGQARDYDNVNLSRFYMQEGFASNDPADRLGDMKILPMVEVTVPNANRMLPGANITETNGLLETYGIQFSYDRNDQDTWIGTMPLNLVTDDETGERLAFSAELPYKISGISNSALLSSSDANYNSILPGTGWGDAHQIRMYWALQMANDRYVPCGADNTESCLVSFIDIVHTYDEPFHLTGMAVREDVGVEMAVAWEDPTLDPVRNEDTQLLELMLALEQTMLAGVDCAPLLNDKCAGDGVVDMSPEEIYRRFNNATNGSVSLTDRYQISDTLSVATKHYESLPSALLNSSEDLAQPALDTIVNAYPLNPIIETNLLYATLHNFRVAGLTPSSGSANDSLVSISLQGERTVALAALNWRPYVFEFESISWRVPTFDEQWASWGDRISSDFADEPLDNQEGLAMSTFIAYQTLQLGLKRFISAETLTSPSDDAQATADLSKQIKSVAKTTIKFTKFFLGVIGKAVNNQNSSTTTTHFGKEFKNALLGKFNTSFGTNDAGNLTWGAPGAVMTAIAGIQLLAGIAGSLITLGVFDGAFLSAYGDKDTAKQAKKDSLLLIKGIVLGLDAINLATKIFDTAVKIANNTLSAATGAARALGAVGLALGIILTWVSFAFTVASGNLTIDSSIFAATLVTSIVSTIYSVALFILGLIAPVGTIIALILAVIDLMLGVLCFIGELGENAENDTLALFKAVCGGIGGAIAKFLYSTQPVFNLADEDQTDLLVLEDYNLRPEIEELGLIPNNTIQLSVAPRMHLLPAYHSANNTTFVFPKAWDPQRTASVGIDMRLGEPYTIDPLSSSYDIPDISEDRDYILKATDTHTDTISELTRAGNWVVVPAAGRRLPKVLGYDNRNYHELYSPSFPLEFAWTPEEAEINSGPDEAQDLQIGLNLPTYVCSAGICGMENHPTTFSQPLGEEDWIYDVFPSTIDEFYPMDWYTVITDTESVGLQHNRPFDFDNDGIPVWLEASDGTDDDKWDSDDDGVSDMAEADLYRSSYVFGGTNLMTALSADIDQDGLCDRDEIRFGTRLDEADSDNDGLTDGEEVFHQNCTTGEWEGGWVFTMTSPTRSGVVTTTVTSSPINPDTDGDGLLDSVERSLGNPYHPRTPNYSFDLYGVVDNENFYVKANQTVTFTSVLHNELAESGFLSGTHSANSVWSEHPQGNTATEAVRLLENGAFHTIGLPLSIPAHITNSVVWSTANLSVQLPGQSSGTPLPERRLYTRVFADGDLPISSWYATDDTISAEITCGFSGYVQPDSVCILGGTASDASSYVDRVEVSEDGGTSWQLASGNELWQHGWTAPSAEGAYTLQVRATDAISNVQATPATQTYIVDGMPPALASAQADSLIRSTPLTDRSSSITLQGTVNDPLSGSSLGSGVQTVWVKVEPSTKTGYEPARLQLDSNGRSGVWSIKHTILGEPTGSYTISVKAADNLGNLTDVGDIVTYQVSIDNTPPKVAIDAAVSAEINTLNLLTQTVQLTGVATDTGKFGSGVALVEVGFTATTLNSLLRNALHDIGFNEINAARYSNRVNGAPPATCGASCPTGNQSGRYGNAVQFVSADGDSLTLPRTLPASDVMLTVWFNTLLDGTLVAVTDGSTTQRSLFVPNR